MTTSDTFRLRWLQHSSPITISTENCWSFDDAKLDTSIYDHGILYKEVKESLELTRNESSLSNLWSKLDKVTKTSSFGSINDGGDSHGRSGHKKSKKKKSQTPGDLELDESYQLDEEESNFKLWKRFKDNENKKKVIEKTLEETVAAVTNASDEVKMLTVEHDAIVEVLKLKNMKERRFATLDVVEEALEQKLLQPFANNALKLHHRQHQTLR